ncbi:diphthine synthase [Stylonychia lemnae]|uniref:diphthine methyl ester synthase n=1 Tax=Stylonychia lemnae TaxID=5949 RepID=A0A078ADN7_STYLE|nr:diphthine synthase [Stylonychia lemnae]|eukprot:CDW79647.1 diphthine synthase [Stylonychia lemnae]
MVLHMIGLGLSDERDISVKGLEAVKSSQFIYLECYTAILMISRERLEEFFGKPIIEADREFVESGCEEMIQNSKDNIVSFLVVGDPFCATTHSDLYLRCVEQGVKVEVIHNASIISAVGCCGLQVYRFGEIVSLPFFSEKWRPYSFYEKIKKNRENGLHTLVLLDIKVKEPTEESLARGKKVYMQPRYMRTHQAAAQMLEAEANLKQNVYSEDTPCMGLVRVGTATQKIVSGKLSEFLKLDLGEPLHSFVICGEMHHIEEEMYNYFLYKEGQEGVKLIQEESKEESKSEDDEDDQ